jgi:uncharacterized DUF497 family protein
MIEFEWHASKATANLKKHQVSFEEAQTVFYDEFAVQFFDEDHSSARKATKRESAFYRGI